MADLLSIHEVEEWEYNSRLRGISQPSIDRLDENSKFGQHSTLLVYFSPDGRKVVVGGNNRVRKWRDDPNYQEVAYVKLEFGEDPEGFYPILDGRTYKNPDGTIPFHFTTIEEGMFQLAQSHNGRYAVDIRGEVEDMIRKYPAINWGMYEEKFSDPVDYNTVKNALTPQEQIAKKEEEEALPKTYKIILTFRTMDSLMAVKEAVENVIQDEEDARMQIKG